jgi:5'-nucleotidase
MVATAAVAAPSDKASDRAHEVADSRNNGKGPKADKPGKGTPRFLKLQLLHFSDFHGALLPDGDGNGGAAQFAGLVDQLEDKHRGPSLLVSSGDSIGGSTFESGLFHDEPTVEILNAMGLDASAIGNHEFDEGYTELVRMIEGGNHPVDGQYLDYPYQGTDFPYLAANVVWADSGEQAFDGSTVVEVDGARIGFVGAVTKNVPTLVSPAGIAGLEFTDEAEAINAEVAELQEEGVEAIVVLLHEGGFPSKTDCVTGPVVDINSQVSAEVDAILSGHTHQTFNCKLPDPEGDLRPVTGPGATGDSLTELDLFYDRFTDDFFRQPAKATTHEVLAGGPVSSEVQDILDRWLPLSEELGATVIGSAAEPILGDKDTDRTQETPMVDLVADAILWGTQAPEDGGAQIALMNIGGVRDEFPAGDITYRDAYNVAPFGNLLVTVTLTGDQLEAVLEQQYQPDADRADMLALGVSEGFTYTWDASKPEGERVVAGSMMLDGVPIDADATYRVATLNFLQEGGDGFTVFTEGTNLTGGPEDLANLVAFVQAESPLTAPEDRVSGL